MLTTAKMPARLQHDGKRPGRRLDDHERPDRRHGGQKVADDDRNQADEQAPPSF